MESIIADKQANFDKITKLFKENIKPNTDIVVLPELWNVGWACDKFIEASEEIKKSETIDLLQITQSPVKTNNKVVIRIQ